MLNIEILSKQGQKIGIFESQQGVFHIVFEDYRYRYDKDVSKEVDCDEIGCMSHEAYRCANYCKGRMHVCFGNDHICRVTSYAHADNCDTKAEKLRRIKKVILDDLINRAITSDNDLKDFKEEFNKANAEFESEHKQVLAKWNSFIKSISRAKAAIGKSKPTISKSQLNQIIPYLVKNQNTETVDSVSSESSVSNVPTSPTKNTKRRSSQSDNEKQKRKTKKIFQANPGYINDNNTSSSTTESDESDTLIDQRNTSQTLDANPVLATDEHQTTALTKTTNENADSKESSKIRRKKLRSIKKEPKENTVNSEIVPSSTTHNDSTKIEEAPKDKSSPTQKKSLNVFKTVSDEIEDSGEDFNDVLHSIGITNTQFDLFDCLDRDEEA